MINGTEHSRIGKCRTGVLDARAEIVDSCVFPFHHVGSGSRCRRSPEPAIIRVHKRANGLLYSSSADGTCVVDLSLKETGKPRNSNPKDIVGLNPQFLVTALGTCALHGSFHNPFRLLRA